MSDIFSEERELLKELRQKERNWKIARWILPFIALYFMFDTKSLNDANLLRIFLAMGLIIYVFSKWQGDTKAKLLIKLYEEKLDNEFLEEEIAKYKSNISKQI